MLVLNTTIVVQNLNLRFIKIIKENIFTSRKIISVVFTFLDWKPFERNCLSGAPVWAVRYRNEPMEASWFRSPDCRCDIYITGNRLSGFQVHQKCLQRWVDEKQRGNVSVKVNCPQCGMTYIIAFPNMGMQYLSILTEVNLLVQTLLEWYVRMPSIL